MSRRRRLRRTMFLLRVKRLAARRGAVVALEVAPDADVSRSVDVEIWSGTTTHVVITSGARVDDHVRLSLRGGSLTVGANTQLRRFGTYHVGGRLVIGAGCVLSTGVHLHCADHLEVGDLTIVGEYTTIADSAHLRTRPEVPVHHHVRTAPVRVGRNVWIGAHAVIASGTTVGDQCFIGAGAVVTDDVPAGWLAAGVPARPLRELTPEDG